jgi:hypothetical protein
MRKARIMKAFVLLMVIVQTSSGLAQGSKVLSADEATAALKGFNSPSWEKRSDAFYRFLGYQSYANWDGRTDLIPSKLAILFRALPDRENELKLALINLLTTENAIVSAKNKELELKGTTISLTEDYTNYYGDLIAAVAGLKDARAVDALVGAMGTGGMATGALAEFGSISLDRIIARLQTGDLLDKGAVIAALDALAQPKNRAKFDEASRQKIKAALLKAAADKDWSIRAGAASALASIPDADTVTVLQKLATSDPIKLPGQKALDGGDYYPVRHAAKMALDQVSRSGTPTTTNSK